MLIACSLFITCTPVLATSDPAAVNGLTLAQAQQLALRNNADFRIAQAQADAALGQLRAVREFPNPVIGYSVGKINTDGRSNATTTGSGFWARSYDSIFSLSQLIELGKRGVRRTSAEAGARSAEALRDDARRLLLQATGQLYFAALEAQQEVRVLGASAASVRKQAAIGSTRLHAGDIAATDQAQIEIAAAQLDLSATSAGTAARIAVMALEALLGYPSPRGETQLADTLEGVVSLPSGDYDTAPARPDLLAAQAALEKSEADLILQRRAALPDLTLALQYEHQPPDQPNTIGVGLSFPLPLWNRNQGNILTAQAARNQAQAQLNKVRTQVAATIAMARAAYEEAKTRSDTYQRNLEPKSASIVRTIEYAYDKGGASLVGLLTAERNDNDLRLASARAQADAASAALALAAAFNRLDPAIETLSRTP